MVTKAILREARKLVAAGWTQGRFVREIGGQKCYCAEGAIMEAAYSVGAAWWLAAGALCKAAASRSLANWNDAPERTKDEVLAAFDKAIGAAA